MEITFGNNFRAVLIENKWEDKKVARLYAPNDLYLAGAYCTEETFEAVAEALMNGYFGGWRDCRAAIKSAVTEAMNVDFESITKIKV